MKTARAMAAAVLIVGSGLGLHLAQQPGAERAALLPPRGGRGRIRDGGHWRTSPRNGDRRRGPADPEPAGEALGQPDRRLPTWGKLSLAPSRRSAFIYAYVLSGEIRSQVDSEPARVYRTGESWFESPGAHHRVSANASDTDPAQLLAVFIVDAADEQLTTTDPQ